MKQKIYNQKYKRWTDAERLWVAELYAYGLSDKEIADRIGRTPGSVSKFLFDNREKLNLPHRVDQSYRGNVAPTLTDLKVEPKDLALENDLETFEKITFVRWVWDKVRGVLCRTDH